MTNIYLRITGMAIIRNREFKKFGSGIISEYFYQCWGLGRNQVEL